jgi:hypothetical protein
MSGELAVTKLRTPRSQSSRTASMIFGAGSLEQMVSGDFDSQSPLYFNIHRERLCAAEHCTQRITTRYQVPSIDESIRWKRKRRREKKKIEISVA